MTLPGYSTFLTSLLERTAIACLHALPAERAHRFVIKALERGIVIPEGRRARRLSASPLLAQDFWGTHFPFPVGLAAGFDKDAVAIRGLSRLSFGFIETGTVTPQAQAGNLPPRLERLPAERALINRMGFNNNGYALAARRLQQNRSVIPVGVNIGAGRDCRDPVGDYTQGIACFGERAAYLAINISSPNTPGLRDWQMPENFVRLTQALYSARAQLHDKTGRYMPLLIKIAPDITRDTLAALVHTAMESKMDGLIISNTTLRRTELSGNPDAYPKGGLSGRPLFRRSTAILATARMLAGADFPLIGVGGLSSPEAALQKIEAGANLVQVYTGLIYYGFSLIERIISHLHGAVERAGVGNIADLSGTQCETWSREWDGK